MSRLKMMAGGLLVAMLATVSLQAWAETKSATRDFNHMTTGFPLTGLHASAACETCHIGGVFKGTPKTCDGCHATGKRIVATPKSSLHIVTDAPCETCHFNTATWLGARYNHGTAKPGQCATCHNGRIAAGKHTGHLATTYACDQCHRSISWIPASWNHTDTASDCIVCHKPGGPGRDKSASHLPMTMGGVTFAGCKACHNSYYTFASTYYNHAGAPTTCNSCHGTYNAPAYSNVTSPTSAIHGALAGLPVTTTCNSCHKSFGTFSAAQFDHVGATACATCHSGAYASVGIKGKHAQHIPYTAGTECSACHGTSSWASTKSGPTLHTGYLGGIACYTCHGSNTAYPGNGQRTERWPNFHESSDNPGATDCSSSNCHKPGAGGKGSLYINWD